MPRTVMILALIALSAGAVETATLEGAAYELTGEPALEAVVELFLAAATEEGEEEEKERPLNLEDHPWLFVDEPLYQTTTDEEGRYRIEDIIPGTYDAVCRSDYSEPCYNLDIHLAAGEERHLNFALREYMEVEKPNIYLYPVRETEITVRLDFPAGGGITVSDPPYGDGWTVRVTPESVIDGGHGHLFYEAEVPPEWQFERAWVVQQRQLETFFTENLTAHGLNDREIADFVEYWVPRLEDHAFYVIYPQYAKEIELMIRLTIEPEPDSLFRLYYAISGVDFVERYVPEPEVQSFSRDGFTCCEWGVVLLSDDQTVH